jgi:hypothetical protein|tara:strand:- start:9610 stop:10140 length:531 start_codon:yes stop_codon:yes gene_type:complete
MSVDRDLKRNVRGQIVSYEIPQPAQVPVGTPLPSYSKVYITSQDGGATTPERFRLGRVLEGTDSVISELQFVGVSVRTNANVRTSLAGATGGGSLASSGFQSSGVASTPSNPSTGQAAAGSAGTTGGVVSTGGGSQGGGGTGGNTQDGSPIGVGGYDSYGFNTDSGPDRNFTMNYL